MAVLRLPDPNLLLSKPRSQKILGLAAARKLGSAGLRQIQFTVSPEDLTCPLHKLARKDFISFRLLMPLSVSVKKGPTKCCFRFST